jgi:hypothetical protein
VIITLLVPVLVFPIVVIAAGGDLDLILQEINAVRRVPLRVAVYAQQQLGPSPTVTFTMGPAGPSPTVTFTMGPGGPSPTVTFTMGPAGRSPTATLRPGSAGPPAGAPLLTRWGMISASIILALIALRAINRRIAADRSQI